MPINSRMPSLREITCLWAFFVVPLVLAEGFAMYLLLYTGQGWYALFLFVGGAVLYPGIAWVFGGSRRAAAATGIIIPLLPYIGNIPFYIRNLLAV
jgi:hypothetical protein